MAHLRTANEFRHDSERRAAEQLRKNLPATCHVVGNYVLPSRDGGGEIDLVVVLPQGIVAIEVKHWYGRLAHVGRLIEFEDGYRVPNPFPGLSYKVKTLRGALMNAGLIDGRLPVGSALVHTLPLAWPDYVRTSEFVFEIAQLTSDRPLLQTLARGNAKDAALSPKEMDAVANFLAEQTSGIDAWSVSHYLLDEESESTAHARQFLGRCAHVFDRNVVLRCWEIDPTAEPAARARTLRELEREASALARLERHRCAAIPVVYDAFRDAANFNVFWLAHEFVGRATLRERAHEFLSDAPFRIFVIEQLDAALAVLRRESLIHRNIRADVVQIAEDGDRVLLGGFEFTASEGDATVRRTVLRPEERPPEVKRGERPSGAGDVYAVGRMVLDLVRSGDDAPKQRLRALKSAPIRKALEQMLDDDPGRRPTDLGPLLETLRGKVS